MVVKSAVRGGEEGVVVGGNGGCGESRGVMVGLGVVVVLVRMGVVMIVVIGVVVVMMMRVCDSDGIGHCGNVDSSRWLMVGVLVMIGVVVLWVIVVVMGWMVVMVK